MPDTDQNPKNTFEIFLIGDTGAISDTRPDPVLCMMRKHFIRSSDSAVIFLGDNAYPRGLPPKGNILRRQAEGILKQHHEVLEGYDGRVIFISGNHDWNKGRRNGLEYVLRQEKYLEDLFRRKKVLLPRGGCPGPEVVPVGENLLVVLINTQWWMQPGVRPIGAAYGCSAVSEADFFARLEDILKNNQDKRILIAGHAPVYSYAIHGGRFKLKHHIFPFTLYHRRAYVPVPVIGSLLPIYRKIFGAREDVAHPRYRRLRHRLKELFRKYPGVIYAAGHEHNLQYITRGGSHFIISGAGSKLKYVIEEGKNLRFGLMAKGFFKLRFEAGGAVHLESWVADRKHPEGKLMYQKQIM